MQSNMKTKYPSPLLLGLLLFSPFSISWANNTSSAQSGHLAPKVDIRVEARGLHCGGCALKTKQTLQNLYPDRIKKVDVHFQTRPELISWVYITLEEDKNLTPEEVKKGIEQTGYDYVNEHRRLEHQEESP